MRIELGCVRHIKRYVHGARNPHTHCVWIKESTHVHCVWIPCPIVLFLMEIQLLFYLLYYSACKNLYEPSKSSLKEVSRTQLFCYWIRLKKLVYKHVYNLVSAFTPEIPGGGVHPYPNLYKTEKPNWDRVNTK